MNQGLHKPLTTLLRKEAGLTLVELMVTLFIASILLSLGGTQFSQFMSNNRMAAAANQINIALHTARTEAIKRNGSVTICATKDWNADKPDCEADATFADGAIMFIDAEGLDDPNAKVDDGDIVMKAFSPLDSSLSLKVADTSTTLSSKQFVSFGPSGFPNSTVNGNKMSYNFQLCDDRGDADTGAGIAAGRWISISPTGRPQMHRKKTTVEYTGNPNGGCGGGDS